MRTSSNLITDLQSNEIFVFGSNQSGLHLGGAAKAAMKWGAIYGQAEGLQGSTYAIPTVDEKVMDALSPEEIAPYVSRFIEFAKEHQEYTFLVTEIGCGIAGRTVSEIAPLFQNAKDVENIHLPQNFWNYLNQNQAME